MGAEKRPQLSHNQDFKKQKNNQNDQDEEEWGGSWQREEALTSSGDFLMTHGWRSCTNIVDSHLIQKIVEKQNIV